MFDISFAELLVIMVIAMVVIGPKRLPETARFVGLWVGRIKRSLSGAYRELDRELGLDDVRRQLHNEEVLRSLEEHKRKLEAELNKTIDVAGPESNTRDSGADADQITGKDPDATTGIDDPPGKKPQDGRSD